MPMRFVILFFLCFGVVYNSLAETNLSTVMGARHLNDSQDVLPVIGFNLTTDRYHPDLLPELTANFSFDPVYGGGEYDLGAGLAYFYHTNGAKVILGGGVSYFSGGYGANESEGYSIYGHCGVISTIAVDLRLGFDLRISEELSSKANYDDPDIGYFQYGIFFEKIWK